MFDRTVVYDLVGETIDVTVTDRSLVSAYPWEKITVPVKITGEYEAFFVGTVQPHRNPGGFGISHPYTVTISKFHIRSGAVILRQGGKRITLPEPAGNKVPAECKELREMTGTSGTHKPGGKGKKSRERQRENRRKYKSDYSDCLKVKAG